MQELSPWPLERQLIKLMANNREGAFRTQDARSSILRSAIRDVVAKFGLQKLENLGQKHIDSIVEKWKDEDTGHRSLPNKLSALRWLLGKVGKQNMLPKSNVKLGVEAGARHTRAGNIIVDEKLAALLARVDGPVLRAMIGLARRLGLRFEEAALLRPHRDFDGKRVWINRGSKGGRPRYLNIHRPEQIHAIRAAQALTAADRGLIPPEWTTYEKFRQWAYGLLRAAGFRKDEGRTFQDLRRTYAVERMRGLVGGGSGRERAAQLVARELGHHRTEVLDWYIAADDLDAGAVSAPTAPKAAA